MPPVLDSWIADLRLAARCLLARPAFTAAATLTLLLGIGTNTTILSLAQALIWRPLPFAEPQRVMVIDRVSERHGLSYLSIPTARDIASRNRVFAATAMFRSVHKSVTGGDGEPERLRALAASHALLEVLGLEPAVGRGFSPEDDRVGAEPALLISHELWTRRYGAERELIGRTVELDRVAYTVIGVLPPGVSKERFGPQPLGDLWVPIGLFFDQLPVDDRADRLNLHVAGRLAPGQSREQARQDMQRLSRELAEEYPLYLGRSSFSITPLRQALVGDVRPMVRLLQATALFLLLIVCANLAHLLLVRAVERRAELATRRALGAGRWQLARLILAESLLLTGLGGTLGWLAAYGLRRPLTAVLAPAVGREFDLDTGGPVLAFTIGLSLLISLTVALFPALSSARLRQTDDLRTRGGAGSRDRLRHLLIATEVALAAILTIGSALMLGSFARLRTTDLGFAAREVLTLQITLQMPKYQEPWAWVGFFDKLHERLAEVSGARAIGLTTQLPLVSGPAQSIVVAGDRAMPPVPDMATTRFSTISGGYFRAMSIPLLHGRTFEAADDDRKGAEPVVIVNRSLAQSFWPADTQQAIGQRLAFEFEGTPEAPQPQWRTIVGVVGDTYHASPQSPPGAAVYTPYTQPALWFVDSWPTMAVVLRAPKRATRLVDQVRASVAEIDAQQPLHTVQPLAQVLDRHLSRPRLLSALLTAFAFSASVLAAVGVYGIVAFTVARRRREIATRMALGAASGCVLRELLQKYSWWIGLGVGSGLAAAAGLTPLIASQLYGVRPLEPWVFAGAAAGLGTLALAATWAPSWRATRIEPAAALRDPV